MSEMSLWDQIRATRDPELGENRAADGYYARPMLGLPFSMLRIDWKAAGEDDAGDRYELTAAEYDPASIAVRRLRLARPFIQMELQIEPPPGNFDPVIARTFFAAVLHEDRLFSAYGDINLPSGRLRYCGQDEAFTGIETALAEVQFERTDLV
jgi:hypothetical protein